jgi:hypothetical protein
MRLLAQHLYNVAATMRLYSKQCGFAEHSDSLGAAREALCRMFMQQHLPQSVSYFTGELFDQKDVRSGQLDLILHPTWSPRLNLIDTIDLVFADAALAVIEVKSSLTTASMDKPSHLKAALDSCVSVKRMMRTATISGVQAGATVTLPRLPVLIFAFEGPTVETLRDKLDEYQKLNQLDSEVLPDLITVLGRGYYLTRNTGWLFPKINDPKVMWSHNSQPEAVLLGMYAYLTKVIEASLSAPQFTLFSEYLAELEGEA